MAYQTSSEQKDERNRRRGLIIALLLHTAVVAGFIYPFLTGSDSVATPYEVVVEMDFREPKQEFSSKAASATERLRNEVKQEIAEREAAPLNPTPPALPTPPSPPILTEPTPMPELEIPDVPAPPAPQPEVTPTPRPSTVPVIINVPARNPGPPPSPTAGQGTASGSSKTTGAPDTGNDGTVADVGEGSADTGEGLDGNGILTRVIIYRPDLKKVVRTNGKLAINVCVDRSGAVIGKKFNDELSTIHDPAVVREAMSKVAEYKFKPDRRAPAQECGVVTIIIKGLE